MRSCIESKLVLLERPELRSIGLLALSDQDSCAMVHGLVTFLDGTNARSTGSRRHSTYQKL